MTPKVPAFDPAGAIKPQKNEFDDNFLDVVGNEFKFDHAKGLAEWIKNSADAYSTTAKIKDAEQFILLRFKTGKPKRESEFECIDFVGMTKPNIDKALKVWGLATAAKRGTDAATYGGHGNGGKFYMRQMFETSRFLTYREGKLNVFGFDEHRQYGYAKGSEEVAMSLDEALKYAELHDIEIPAVVQERWKRNQKAAGFTVVRGHRPGRFSGKATVTTMLERLRVHPQARRLLRHQQVIYLGRNQTWGVRLETPRIDPREGFEKPRELPLPKKFTFNGEEFEFRSKKYPSGKLVLRSSNQPLARSPDMAAMNAIDILGEIGCIGSYRMHELGFMRYAPESEFIYGECEAPFLEEKELDCVKNDREKLVKNELTDALIAWIKQEVDALAEEMADRRKHEKKSRDLRESALFNQLLDRWKNKFMAKLTGELFGGSGIGDSFGGSGGGAEGKTSKDENGGGKGDSKNTGENGDGGGGAGDEKRKGPKFPRVLLSSYDADPFNDKGGTLDCDERHPPLYQRDVDIEGGVYWINTSRPLANRIMDQYGANDPRWREYMFQRYVEIILKQSLYELNKRDPDLTAYKVDGLIDDVTLRVHDAAAQDLESFLFDDQLTGSAAIGSKSDADSAGGDDGPPDDIDAPESIPSMGELLSSTDVGKAGKVPQKRSGSKK